MKVVILKGLPASGKSTYAKELVAKGNWCRVNKDDLRTMCHDGRWSKHNEKLVLSIRDLTIIEALSAGQNIVVDDTNFEPKHEARVRELVSSFKPQIEVKFFDTPLEECIKRDLQRPHSVGKDVIVGMYNKYLKPVSLAYHPPEDKPLAILCDIDGTLAHMKDRGPFDWSKVGSDLLDNTIATIVRDYTRGHVILLSGRDEVCRRETEDWLDSYNIHRTALYMRPKGDMRKDVEVKRELFEQYIRENYQVEFVLDDRNQIVEMWRSIGLKVLQVEDGDF